MIKHVVLMKFKEDIQEAQIVELEKGLGGLPGVMEEIKGYEFGRDVIGSERSYDFALVSLFDDLEALGRYQTHPSHVVILNLVREICASIVAVDFNC